MHYLKSCMGDHTLWNWEFKYAIQYSNWRLESNLDHRNIGNHQLNQDPDEIKIGELGSIFSRIEKKI